MLGDLLAEPDPGAVFVRRHVAKVIHSPSMTTPSALGPGLSHFLEEAPQ
jgi:hypothetical protein